MKLIHILNYECEAHSHLSYYCEAHSQLCYACEAHSHLSYYWCTMSVKLIHILNCECEAHSHLSYQLLHLKKGFRFRISVRGRVRVQ